MFKFFIISLLTCACNLQAQVWTSLVDSVPNFGWAAWQTHYIDSTTNNIYFGGTFQKFNQFNNRSIIKYNGISFDTLGSGLDKNLLNATTQVTSIQKFQNKLYVFGNFQKTGNYFCKHIGRWNGSSWDTVNFKPNGSVWFSDIYNNELYVAGDFDTIGGIKSTAIAKYNGTNWQSLNYPNGCVTAIKNFKNNLYVAGATSSLSSCANISYFDGSNWIPFVGVSGDNAKYITGMTVIDTMLYVYGRFNSIAGTNCKGLVAYNGSRWYSFGNGLSNSSWETIYNVQKVNGKIYATGVFGNIEGVETSSLSLGLSTNLAVLDNNKWCLLSAPFDNKMCGVVNYNNNLYAYGACRRIGNDTVWGLLKWTGGNSTIVCSNTIAISLSTIGINEIINFNDIKIYPNPINEKLNIEFPNFQFQNTSIQIINSQGQLIFSSNINSTNNEIDFSNISKGIYFLKIQNSNTQKVFKIIKE